MRLAAERALDLSCVPDTIDQTEKPLLFSFLGNRVMPPWWLAWQNEELVVEFFFSAGATRISQPGSCGFER